ncbi:sortase domain-bontaining protein [Microbacterium sp. P03]|uniref:sortase domain-containing protein n=1 Tax=Microbacterium sp. P03 TaxID=3366946 RepID=UPI0037477671
MKRLALPLALVAVLLSGCSTPAPPAADVQTATPTPTASPTSTPPPTAAIDVPIVSSTPGAITEAQPPTRVVIPAIAADVPVIPVGVETTGAMELPADPAVAGWYRYGVEPSSGQGNTVIAAHIDSPDYPIGPFASLRDLAAGSDVEVTSATGAVTTYAVESITYYPKAELPIDQLFARTGAPSLVLITCGGEFDASTGHYRDNVVLVARPIS